MDGIIGLERRSHQSTCSLPKKYRRSLERTKGKNVAIFRQWQKKNAKCFSLKRWPLFYADRIFFDRKKKKKTCLQIKVVAWSPLFYDTNQEYFSHDGRKQQTRKEEPWTSDKKRHHKSRQEAKKTIRFPSLPEITQESLIIISKKQQLPQATDDDDGKKGPVCMTWKGLLLLLLLFTCNMHRYRMKRKNKTRENLHLQLPCHNRFFHHNPRSILWSSRNRP